MIFQRFAHIDIMNIHMEGVGMDFQIGNRDPLDVSCDFFHTKQHVGFKHIHLLDANVKEFFR